MTEENLKLIDKFDPADKAELTTASTVPSHDSIFVQEAAEGYYWGCKPG
jgi:hypothetical protein